MEIKKGICRFFVSPLRKPFLAVKMLNTITFIITCSLRLAIHVKLIHRKCFKTAVNLFIVLLYTLEGMAEELCEDDE